MATRTRTIPPTAQTRAALQSGLAAMRGSLGLGATGPAAYRPSPRLPSLTSPSAVAERNAISRGATGMASAVAAANPAAPGAPGAAPAAPAAPAAANADIGALVLSDPRYTNVEHAMLRQRLNALINFGDATGFEPPQRTVTDEAGNPIGTLQDLAAGNTHSTLANLMRTLQHNEQRLGDQANARGLYYSGARAQAQVNEAAAGTQREYSARQALQSNLDALLQKQTDALTNTWNQIAANPPGVGSAPVPGMSPSPAPPPTTAPPPAAPPLPSIGNPPSNIPYGRGPNPPVPWNPGASRPRVPSMPRAGARGFA